jgi:signal transduction histidine kinase
VFVLILHFRIIKKSLSEFKSTINKINSGDLDCRVDIPQSKELGELGHSFNTMIDHFQQAQKELQKYHLEEIRNKQKLASIGEMSARLAHEIRNPITGIANAIEIILGETKESQNMPVLEEIQRQANRVNKAISNLLKFSRTKELNVQEASINDIIKSIVFFLKSQGNGKIITYKVELDEDIPSFKFDPEQIENVFLNLGINATQTIDKEGTITIRSSYDPYQKQVTISFSDTGKGIPENKISEIFNPFFTLRTEGTGLGLAIVKEIIDMHNGSILVYNNPDHGATFQITLPVNK